MTHRDELQPTRSRCAERGYALSADVPPETWPSGNRKCDSRDVGCHMPGCGMRGQDPRLPGGKQPEMAPVPRC